MDDYGTDLYLFYAHDLRLVLRADQSMGAYGFCPYIGNACWDWMMVNV